jgi:radical SAM protein with 4Fe4S-binding SPASM domain
MEETLTAGVGVSTYLHFLQVDKDTYIGWNRYFPSIFILNRNALQLLDDIKNKNYKAFKDNTKLKQHVDRFKKYNFVYEGESDPSREDFILMIHKNLELPKRRAAKFYKNHEDYDELKIVNDDCNLNCSYCVNNYHRSPHHSPGIKKRDTDKNKIETLNHCIDQYFARKIKNGTNEAKIYFNGGEILLEWDLIKKILRRISHEYKDFKIQYGINTNLTLLTEEMARFFKQHHFKVSISIDGCREAHDKTRKYRNGKGSFADIIKKVNLYREIYNAKVLTVFQGTLEHVEELEPEEVYKMSQYGFTTARLAPNLLDTSEEDARRKARLMGEFLQLNDRHDFQVTELIFTKSRDKINQEEYNFSFNCRGLCALPRMGIEINLSTMSLSHLCGFIPRVALPLGELGYDIYHPKLWDISAKFIKERMDSVLNHCMECELVGICTGGCILSGMDSENRINKAACAYQKEMWNIYVKKAYEDDKKN